jgi:hypothetical protein
MSHGGTEAFHGGAEFAGPLARIHFAQRIGEMLSPDLRVEGRIVVVPSADHNFQYNRIDILPTSRIRERWGARRPTPLLTLLSMGGISRIAVGQLDSFVASSQYYQRDAGSGIYREEDGRESLKSGFDLGAWIAGDKARLPEIEEMLHGGGFSHYSSVVEYEEMLAERLRHNK